jgi:hypothetical protein
LPGASSIWRNEAPGTKKSLPMVLFVSCFELST